MTQPSNKPTDMSDEVAKLLLRALAAWDRYQPDISREQLFHQARELAEAARKALATLSTPSPQGVADALARCVRFTAYSVDDPLALRFEFVSTEDRLAAANAIDEALSSLPLSEGGL